MGRKWGGQGDAASHEPHERTTMYIVYPDRTLLRVVELGTTDGSEQRHFGRMFAELMDTCDMAAHVEAIVRQHCG